jgi:hypothetical protein
MGHGCFVLSSCIGQREHTPKDRLKVPSECVVVHAVPRLIERWMEGEVPYGNP